MCVSRQQLDAHPSHGNPADGKPRMTISLDQVGAPIAWSDEFLLGHERIDAQHRRLVDMINRLVTDHRLMTSSDTVERTLKEMADYARYHFETEEEIMSAVAYPGMESHVAQHRAFQMKSTALMRSASVNSSAVPTVLLNYLSKWLRAHILERDMAFKPYLTRCIKL